MKPIRRSDDIPYIKPFVRLAVQNMVFVAKFLRCNPFLERLRFRGRAIFVCPTDIQCPSIPGTWGSSTESLKPFMHLIKADIRLYLEQGDKVV